MATDDPQDAVVAQQLKTDPVRPPPPSKDRTHAAARQARFAATARSWTELHAKEGSLPPCDSSPSDCFLTPPPRPLLLISLTCEDRAAQQLLEMGFTEAQVRAALAKAGGNAERAVELLLSS